MRKKRISHNCIRRISIYVRELEKLERDNIEFLSSKELGDSVGYKPSQIRKDLSFFGQFGKVGRGYEVKELKNKLSNILGIQRKFRKVAIVGVGNLGSALLYYPGFKKHGFRIIAAFDNNPKKVNKKKEGIYIRPVSELPSIVKGKKIDIGIITVPASSAQEIANLLVDSGIRAILNFAPVRLEIPEDIILEDVDLTVELESLAYFLTESK